MGIELRMLCSAVYPPGPLGNTMFLRWQFVNKSDADYDSVFFAIESDIDMGDANDDLPGSDSLLGLGFVYNGDNDDNTHHGYGSTPPACGFTLLRGPAVPGLPSDSVRIGGRWVWGLRNLPATSFTTIIKTFSQLTPTPDGSPDFVHIVYNYLRGKTGTTGESLYGSDSTVMSFWFSGDPVKQTGDLPTNFTLGRVWPQDIQGIILSTGPFTLARGDTQEVDAAFVIAQGNDRLGSVTELKQAVSEMRQYFASSPDTLPGPYGRELHSKPSHIAFDPLELGTSSDSVAITLTNTGLDTVVIEGVSQSGDGQFVVEGPPEIPYTIPRGTSVTMRVWFSPTIRGVIRDTVRISTNATWGPERVIPLRGRAVTGFSQAHPGVIYGHGKPLTGGSYSLFSIDPATGEGSVIGEFHDLVRGPLTIRPSRRMLQMTGNEEYNYTSEPVTLFDLSPVTGDIRPASDELPFFPSAIAYSTLDTLFAAYRNELYRISLPDGEATLIGTTQGITGYGGLAFNPISGSLWGFTGKTLLGINASTGIATPVVEVDHPLPMTCMAFDSDGSLYGVMRSPYPWIMDRMVRIDTVSGLATDIGPIKPKLEQMAMRTDTLKVESVQVGREELPRTYELHQNYPNPFNPTTTIRYELPVRSYVTLKVFNILGEEVATLVDGVEEAGFRSAQLDAGNLASGVYFYRLRSTDFIETRKLMVLK
jgi:hypothetical protein